MRAELLSHRASAALAKEARVSEEQVQAYYEKHRAELRTPEAARLQMITVKDKARADDVLRALRKGADFATLAQGRDLGWVNAETLPPALHKAVARLKVGETSGPVQYGSDFVIVRLVAQRPAGTRTLAEARPAIEQRLLRAKQNETIMAWLAKQEKASKIEIFL
jgi:parvulin-like peptidyl-prolyl isomerase